MWALVKENKIQQVFKAPQKIVIENIHYPKTIFTDRSEESLEQLGLYKVHTITERSSINSKYLDIKDTFKMVDNKAIHSVSWNLKPLEELKAIKLQEVKDFVFEAFSKGIEFKDHIYDIDKEAQTNIFFEYLLDKDMSKLWRTKDNEVIVMMPEEFENFTMKCRGFVAYIKQRKWDLEKLVQSIDDPLELSKLEIK